MAERALNETIPVRPDERLDTERLLRYMRAHLELPAGDLAVEQFPSGHSNLTYLLRIGAWEAVLRRPPLGPVAPKAHDMERECRLLSALHPVFPRAPKPYVFCADPAVIGSTFYIMERLHGVVLDEHWPAELPLQPEICRRITEGAVDTLVELQGVDWRAAGLVEMGHPEGYLKRQVEGWLGRYERAKTDELAEMVPLARWLTDDLPVSPPAVLIHNDFKLNNMMLDPGDLGHVVGVVDWEMSTLGDPLADVALMLAYWTEPADAAELDLKSVTMLPEFPGRRDVLELYARRSGRDVSQINWYLGFSFFKIAVICQQIYFRWKTGQTKDPRFQGLGPVAISFIRRANGLSHSNAF